jgi:hypothetical protein
MAWLLAQLRRNSQVRQLALKRAVHASYLSCLVKSRQFCHNRRGFAGRIGETPA